MQLMTPTRRTFMGAPIDELPEGIIRWGPISRLTGLPMFTTTRELIADDCLGDYSPERFALEFDSKIEAKT